VLHVTVLSVTWCHGLHVTMLHVTELIVTWCHGLHVTVHASRNIASRNRADRDMVSWDCIIHDATCREVLTTHCHQPTCPSECPLPDVNLCNELSATDSMQLYPPTPTLSDRSAPTLSVGLTDTVGLKTSLFRRSYSDLLI